MIVLDTTESQRTVTVTVLPGGSNPGGVVMGVLFQSGADLSAAAERTDFAAGKLRLYQQGMVSPNPLTTKAALEAAECTFSGYPAGGLSVATWNDGGLEGNGASLNSSVERFAFTPPGSGTPVENTVGGWWYEDAAGVPRIGGPLPSPYPMFAAGAVLQLVAAELIASAVGG